MDAIFETVYDEGIDIFSEARIDLNAVVTLDPWVVGLICLIAIENKDALNKSIVLPSDRDASLYLKSIQFGKFMGDLSYAEDVSPLDDENIDTGKFPNVCEIILSNFRDEFSARLASRIRLNFRSFGMPTRDEQLLTALVGELGNNVFDHNDGSWPKYDARGAIVVAQHYPDKKRVDVIVADPGVGFLGSLKTGNKGLKDDVTAIELGLTGVTGRVGEDRGNGLIVIQDWTLNKFNGMLRIHSGSGLVVVEKRGQRTSVVPNIGGTLAGLVIFYK